MTMARGRGKQFRDSILFLVNQLSIDANFMNDFATLPQHEAEFET